MTYTQSIVNILLTLCIACSVDASIENSKKNNDAIVDNRTEKSTNQTESAVSLLSIYHMALINDMTLNAARTTYRASRENMPIARSALLPQLKLTALNSWNKQVNNLSSAANEEKHAGAPRTFGWNHHGWGASLTQPVFDASAWFSLSAAGFQNTYDRIMFDMTQQNLIMRVATSYFNVLQLEDTVATACSEQRAVEKQLIQARERYRVGLLPRADVEEAKASYDAVLVKVIETKNQVNLAYKALTVITGKPITHLSRLGLRLGLSRPDPEQPSAWVQKAIANNLSLKASHAGVQINQMNLKSAKAMLLPKLSAYTTFTHTDINTIRQLDKSDITVYGININMPILTGGNTLAQITQEGFNLESSQYMEELQTRLVNRDALGAYDSVITDIVKMQAVCQGVISAGAAFKVTDSGYRAGIRTIMDVLQAQQSLYSAQQSYFNARYSYILDMLKLKQAAGTLSPADLVQLNELLSESTHSPDIEELIPVCQREVQGILSDEKASVKPDR